MDAEKKYVICATKGKDLSTLKICKEHLEAHSGDAEKVEEFCMDKFPALIKDVEDYFPKAAISFDKFHVIKTVNEAADEVRRSEQKSCVNLKLETAKAYRMKICL